VNVKATRWSAGFNTEVADDVRARAKSLGVQVETFDVIYALLDDVRARMEGRLKAVTEKVPCGKAVVKAMFGKGAT
jgi:translation initiation factor IF-2